MAGIPLPGFPDNLSAQTVTIASGAAVSEMIATQGRALIGIWTPTSGWTAAAIGYKTCFSGNANDLVFVYGAGGAISQTLVSTDAAAASIFIAVPQPDTTFVGYLQIASCVATATTATNQAADRTLILLFRNYLN